MRTLSCLCAAALLAGLTIVAAAQDKKKDSAKKAEKPAVKLEVAVTSLLNPCGVAIQTETGHVFIADSGNLRVLRYEKNMTPTEAIVGFPKDVYGKGPMYDIGPLGLTFLNKNTLVVGGGGLPDGSELLRFFDVTDNSRQQAKDAKHTLGPIGPTKGKTEKGEGNFYALAYLPPSAVFVTTNGDDTKGWVVKATIEANVPKDLELFIPTKVFTEDVDAPVGIAISPEKTLVIGQMGEITKPKDSLLLVYDPNSGKALKKYETGLYDITALAYHPKSNNLYALDFAWMKPEEGGLFRLTIKGKGDKATVEAVKIDVVLDKPTAMAFDEKGDLYVTEIGTAKKDAKKTPGRLVRIVGLE